VQDLIPILIALITVCGTIVVSIVTRSSNNLAAQKVRLEILKLSRELDDENEIVSSIKKPIPMVHFLTLFIGLVLAITFYIIVSTLIVERKERIQSQQNRAIVEKIEANRQEISALYDSAYKKADFITRFCDKEGVMADIKTICQKEAERWSGGEFDTIEVLESNIILLNESIAAFDPTKREGK
jgi:hypothetical protein